MAFIRRAAKAPYVVKVGTRRSRMGWVEDGPRPRPNTFVWNQVIKRPAVQRAYMAQLRRKRSREN